MGEVRGEKERAGKYRRGRRKGWKEESGILRDRKRGKIL